MKRQVAEQRLAEVQQIATEKGGVCLSAEYINNRTPLKFRCKDGHEWSATPNTIVSQGSWCLLCSHKKHGESQRASTLKKLQRVVEEKGGQLLSPYTLSNEKHRFRCKEGHEWDTLPSSVQRGHWCPYCKGCNGRNPEFELETIKRIAAAKGGQCLSEQYVHINHPLRFRCTDGHEWETTPGNVKSGTWCPQCFNVTEALVRQFFEAVFEVEFPNTAPAWLQSPNRGRCVLDGYNEQLRMAFEYHGLQHFQHVDYFHKYVKPGSKTLLEQQERDAYVRLACEANDVLLIEVLPLPNRFTQAEFIAHVRRAIEAKRGSDIPESAIVRYSQLPARASKLQQIKAIAESQGGACLSTKYVSSISKMMFRCAKGHEFEAIPKTVQKGHWCQQCGFETTASKRRLSIEYFKSLAMQRGGECLSIEYANTSTQLKFRCRIGHEWETAAANARAGKWCPQCAAVERGKALRAKNIAALEASGQLAFPC